MDEWLDNWIETFLVQRQFERYLTNGESPISVEITAKSGKDKITRGAKENNLK